ncbi:Integrin beta-1-binding protein 2 [Bienertia sinuspersici]
MADEVSLDLVELRHLQTIAKRPRVVSLISSEIRNLEKILIEKASPSVAQHPTPTPISVTSKAPSTAALMQEDKMEKNIKPMSIELKFHDVHGKNYVFAIPKLNMEVLPEQCKVIIKPTRVTIVLVKASKGNWVDLHFKEDKVYP